MAPGLADGWSESPRVIARALDVRNPNAWREAMAAVVEKWGRLDVLVNVAGILVLVWAP